MFCSWLSNGLVVTGRLFNPHIPTHSGLRRHTCWPGRWESVKKKLTPTSMEQCSWQAHELLRWRWRWRWRWSCPCQRHEGISVSRGMERIRGTQWIGCGFSPRAGLDVWKKITCPLLGFERWAFQFVASRCTDLTLFRYHFYFMNVKFPGVECVCVCVCVL